MKGNGMYNPPIQMKNIQTEFSRLIENSSSEHSKHLRTLIFDAFSKGIQAVMPEQLINNSVHLNATQLTISNSPSGQHIQYNLLEYSKLLIIGGGKATAGLVSAFVKKVGSIIECYGSINIPKGQESQWGNSIEFISDSGIASKIDIVYASHPIPDNNGLKGTKKIIELVSHATPTTFVLVVISGGGSALMPLPKSPITISSLQILNDVLLKSGANIVEINSIRKHISDIKGGQLAKFIHPRTALSLILSDVKGDPLDSIASGPTAHDTSTFANAWDVIEKYRIVHIVPESIRVVLRKGVNGLLQETPKQDHPVFSKMTNFVIGSATTVVSEIKEFLRKNNTSEIRTITPPELNGEAKNVGEKLAKLILTIEPEYLPSSQGFLTASGECTVTVNGNGKGGRNQEMLLSMVNELKSKPKLNVQFALVSMAFDGIEGNSPAAGAVIDTDTMKKAISQKLDGSKFLSENDSYSYFKILGDAIEIGQSGTNVNDVYCLIIAPKDN
jgi:glycerate 2-kinase